MKTMRRVLAGIGVMMLLALAQTASAISATGGTVTKLGGYTYHTFTSSGTFTVTAGGNAQVLVVGGGGGGGASGGGGGAGGVLKYSPVILPSGEYTITVGTGGEGGIPVGGEDYGASGGNSGLSGGAISLTADGGGGGAVYLDYDGEGALVVGQGLPGGSGGGARGYSGEPGGTTTGVGMGNNGGAGATSGDSPNYGSGGGGGYTAAGGAGSSTAGGNGGEGLTLDSFTAQLSAFSGMTVIASGGGGGCYWAGGENPVGTGGTGGTGAGNGSATDAQAGGNAVSFGSGGGGGGQGPALATGGNGAPGVVVVRYGSGSPVASYLADFAGTNFPAHWRYQWNANGPFGDTNNYVNLLWNDSWAAYYADANLGYPTSAPAPANYLQLNTIWGFPGSSVSGGPFIWTHEVGPLVGYTVSAPGLYAVEGRFYYFPDYYSSEFSTGVGLKIYVNNTLSDELTVTGTATNTFSTILGSLNAGDTIYVALAPGDTAASDATEFDFTILRDSGAPQGTLIIIR